MSAEVFYLLGLSSFAADSCPPVFASSTKVSRSGRLIKPPLEYWKGGRVILDAHMNVTVFEGYDTSICNPVRRRTQHIGYFHNYHGDIFYLSSDIPDLNHLFLYLAESHYKSVFQGISETCPSFTAPQSR